MGCSLSPQTLFFKQMKWDVKMNEQGMEPSKGRFLVYEAPDGELKLDVRLEDETVWLTQ